MGRRSREKRERRAKNLTPGYGALDRVYPALRIGAILARALPFLLFGLVVGVLVLAPEPEFVVGRALLGVVLTGTQGWALLRVWFTRDWKETEGVILSSRLARDSYAGDQHLFWSPVVTYTYEVNGTPYTSKRISLTGSGVKNSAGGAARQAIHEFAVGKRVLVWYDPDNPSRAALYRDAGVTTWVLFGVGAFLLLFALYAGIGILRM